MDLKETAQLLAKAQLVDNRNVDHLVLAEWADDLQDVTLEEAIWALKQHRRTSTDWLQPAHIIKGAREYRKQQAQQRAKQAALEAGTPKARTAPPAWFSKFLAEFKEASKL